MSLLALPDEILVMTLFLISKDKGQLYRTALVNRRFALLIRPILPRSIYFGLDYKRESGLERCQQYLRSCSERPELGNETRNVNVVWHKTPSRVFGCRNDIDTAALLDGLITKWSNARRLRIYCPQRSGRVSLPSLCLNPFPELHHLHLNLPPLSITQVLHFLNLPKLRSIEIDRISDSHLATDSRHQRHITACVERFHSAGEPLHPVTLQNIVASAQSTLTSLHCKMPGRTRSRYNFIDEMHMLDTFSPALLKEILRPLRDTLTNLRLDTDSMMWPSHDQSKLELTDFISLKTVTLSSRFLFEEGLAGWLRTGVWRLLPVSIEKLAVCLAILVAPYSSD